MSTEDNGDPVVESGPERRPGEELARAREQAGIGLRAMADTLHLPENQLRALEADDYDSLPPPTFVRGYLRSYARVLGLDDDEIVGAYDALGSASADPQLYLSGGREATAHRRGLALALTALALAVAVSLGAWWWQSRATSSPVDPLASETQADDASQSEPAEDAGEDTARAESTDDAHDEAADDSATVSAEEAEGDEANDNSGRASTADPEQLTVAEAEQEQDGGLIENVREPREEPVSPATDTEEAPEVDSGARTFGLESTATEDTEAGEADGDPSTPAQADAGQAAEEDETEPSEDQARADELAAQAEDYEPPAATASADAARSPLAVEGPDRLRLNLDGRSWIEITDARGRELVYTLYTGSAPLELRGWAPFNVFLGNSPAVGIEFNGDSVEKSVFTRSDNTARFLVDGEGARRR